MTKIRYHHDADGITSAYLLSYGVKSPVLDGWDGEFGDTTGLAKGDWMVDMRPLQNMEGLNVIDHHLPHREDRAYKLISDNVPASLITWREFKEEIPKSEWWKVVIGIVGDGQPELIPTEVFDSCPQLLSNVKTSSYVSYGKWKIGYYPAYKLLSSYINAFLRQHKFTEALNLLTYSQNPLNILNSKSAQMAKQAVKTEFENIIRSCNSYDFGNFALFLFNSDFRMSGYVASVMQGALDGKTVISINRKDGSGSIRGDLAFYWKDKLSHLDYLIIGGHPGFCGLTLKANPETFLKDLFDLV